MKLEDIRTRLQGVPTLNAVRMAPSDYELIPELAQEQNGRVLRPAAVLLAFVEQAGEATLLFTTRTPTLSSHAGQVSFPGGRIDGTDGSPEQAALREAYEEIGLPASNVEVVGRLAAYETLSGYHITPVLGFVTQAFVQKPNPDEVADIFNVPVRHLINPANIERQSALWQGAARHYYAIPYEARLIWGATAGMVVHLARRLGVAV
jgi:8-oxo-dGTP pyrophosphatase MutT (NUDIX family)